MIWKRNNIMADPPCLLVAKYLLHRIDWKEIELYIILNVGTCYGCNVMPSCHTKRMVITGILEMLIISLEKITETAMNIIIGEELFAE